MDGMWPIYVGLLIAIAIIIFGEWAQSRKVVTRTCQHCRDRSTRPRTPEEPRTKRRESWLCDPCRERGMILSRTEPVAPRAR